MLEEKTNPFISKSELNSGLTPNSNVGDNKNLNRREISKKDYIIPDYVLPENKKKRHRILSNLPLSQEMISMFNELCDFILNDNDTSPVVIIKRFFNYLNKRNLFASSNRQKILTQLIGLLDDDDVQLMQVLDEDENNFCSVLLLKEHRDVDLKSLTKLEKYLENTYKKVEAKKTLFPDIKSCADDLRWKFEQVQDLCIILDIKDLTLKQLLKSSTEKNYVAVIIKLPENLREIVVPNNFISKLIYVLVDMIRSYYETDENKNVNKTIKKKLKEEELDIGKIHEVLINIRIQDHNFFKFSQVFYSVMTDLLQQMGTNSHDYSIKNLAIASVILSKLSFNRREEVRTSEANKFEKEKHFKEILNFILTNHISTKYKEKIFYPTNLDEILALEIVSNKKVDVSKIIKLNVSIGSKYNENDILKFFKDLNEGSHSIPQIMMFENHNQVFYIHRARLITTFFSLLDNERIKISSLIKKKWQADSSSILRNHQEEEFYLLVEEYISSFFSDFHKMCLSFILANQPNNSVHSKNEYILNRLFLNEKEMLELENVVPDLIINSSDKRKKIMKLFMETLFTEHGHIRKKYEILQIPFSSLIAETMEGVNLSLFQKFKYYFLGFWYELFDIINHYKTTKFFNGLKDRGKVLINQSNTLLNKTTDAFEEVKRSVNSNRTQDSNAGEPTKLKQNTSTITQNRDKAKKDLGMIRKNIPEISDQVAIKSILTETLDSWNQKIGSARHQTTTYVDDVVEKMADRIDVAEISQENIKKLFNPVIQNNQGLSDIANNGDQNALQKYMFYKLASIKFNELRK